MPTFSYGLCHIARGAWFHDVLDTPVQIRPSPDGLHEQARLKLLGVGRQYPYMYVQSCLQNPPGRHTLQPTATTASSSCACPHGVAGRNKRNRRNHKSDHLLIPTYMYNARGLCDQTPILWGAVVSDQRSLSGVRTWVCWAQLRVPRHSCFI